MVTGQEKKETDGDRGKERKEKMVLVKKKKAGARLKKR